MRIPVMPVKYLGRFVTFHFFWHFGLLSFIFLPYPGRLAIIAALIVDAMCFVYFFYWLFTFMLHPELADSTYRKQSR